MLKRKSKRRAAYVDLPERIYSWLDGRRNVVLLETSRYDAHNHRSFLFFDPIRVESIHRVGEVGELLHTLQAATTQGYYAAGYVAYECGAYFEPARLSVDMKADHEQPLAWFGIYRAPVIFDHATGVLSGLAAGELAEEIDEGDILSGEIGAIHDVEFDQTPADYAAQIARIMEYIRAGDTYQVNYTGRYRFRLSGSPLALYRRLRGKQRISHGAYLSGDDWQIACLSPELFFRIDGDTITVKPMKGTAPRGRTPAEDCQQADWLRNDEKNRAENVMIVDLLRNDLGRLCRVGSVHVPDLFTVERYETLFQMTSTVAGALASDRSYTALFRSLFPCGSVTGAPESPAA
jgi:para-aminobenzoate synthetase/4-amino-4-deoxychorismate lyase